ncbi:1,4-dihydroxy-2-naphthoate octaprenyltransferase [Salimicrobium halophilum]|uniref:1,4-dihydroxy-2-naphthoate octaprenyltransferase n=2 Tax=Salimicrobium halophilum TaxID=86666 RepID=A0A1G8S463_9BACI|nr:1,4-dihydroxy-2-naphthoate octaprenyltransferase [Salimicrobium halophilum]
MNAISMFRTGFTLLRLIAVLFSSFAAIITTMLPLYLYYSFPLSDLLRILSLLLLGTILIHGFLTHVLNDYMDSISGTDTHSPGILSGGSGVVRSGQMTTDTLRSIGRVSIAAVLISILAFLILGYVKIAVLLAIGLYSAVAYSLPSLRFSYYPLLGEWVATFPAVYFIGLGGVWLLMDQPPVWAVQNAMIVSIFCLAWIMVHHIPDRYADEQATPAKVTSVVWMKRTFGDTYSRFPAILYFAMAASLALWLGTERMTAALGILILSIVSILIVINLKIEDPEQVSNGEKQLLILTMVAAIWLGIFI